MTAVEILSLVYSSLDRLGITPYIQAYLIAVIAIAVVAMIYAKFNRS